LVLLITSFIEDQNSSIIKDPDNYSAISFLRKIGILPAVSLKYLVLRSSKKSFKLKLPLQMEMGVDQNQIKEEDIRFVQYINYLKSMCLQNTCEDNKHIIVIDGLDDILTGENIQYVSLASLITEVSRLNALLKEHAAPGKFIVLCRTDLFERLPAPNKNKLRQDWAHEFDWFHNPMDPSSSELVTLANLRARLSLGHPIDIFQEYFPDTIQGKNIYSYLLGFTRQTPRDFIQLLVYMQKQFKISKLTEQQVSYGIKDYSKKYFLPEIRDELSGYLDRDIIELVWRMFASFGRKEFYIDSLYDFASKRILGADKANFNEIFHTLYECSAIRNIIEKKGSEGIQRSFCFKNRYLHTSIDFNKQIVIHRAIAEALDI